MSYTIGIDIGGTFTDCVAVDGAGQRCHAKSLSTGDDPSRGVLAGLTVLSGELGLSLSQLLGETRRLSHGTTIGTNLVVERKGAKVGYVGTQGHGDVLLMMRGTGRFAGLTPEQVYDCHSHRTPLPLVDRRTIAEVRERIDSEGNVVVPLDEEQARDAIRRLVEEEAVEALAICLLWAVKNPAHEQRLAEIAAEIAPGLFISVSSTVSLRVGEFERAVATMINAYVGPASSAYLDRTLDRLEKEGLQQPLLVMQSNGGVVPVPAVKDAPIRTIDSGPVGGLVGSAVLAHAYQDDKVIATDMGGTSFDVGLIVGGEPVMASHRVIEKYTYQLPHLHVRSVACGGGTIAWCDEVSNSIRVGPRSAGSNPGPACYGRGGCEATVTDADVVLGLVRTESFLAGRMPLDEEAAWQRVAELGERVGLPPLETAAGILRINNNAAATLIRQQTVERGEDARDFVIYAFGGAGPVHAFGFGPELGVSRVVVPLANGASTLSAFGIAASDIVQHGEYEAGLVAPFAPDALGAMLEQVEERGRKALTDLGYDPTDIVIARSALLRYSEQYMNTVSISIPHGPIDEPACRAVRDAFDSEYARRFGEGAGVVFQSVELYALRIRASVPAGRGIALSDRLGSHDARRSSTRKVFWPSAMRQLDSKLYDGARIKVGDRIEGPAIVELPHTTVPLAPGHFIERDALGSLVLTF